MTFPRFDRSSPLCKKKRVAALTFDGSRQTPIADAFRPATEAKTNGADRTQAMTVWLLSAAPELSPHRKQTLLAELRRAFSNTIPIPWARPRAPQRVDSLRPPPLPAPGPGGDWFVLRPIVRENAQPRCRFQFVRRVMAVLNLRWSLRASTQVRDSKKSW